MFRIVNSREQEFSFYRGNEKLSEQIDIISSRNDSERKKKKKKIDKPSGKLFLSSVSGKSENTENQ